MKSLVFQLVMLAVQVVLLYLALDHEMRRSTVAIVAGCLGWQAGLLARELMDRGFKALADRP